MNITFSADENLIEAARRIAVADHTTLDEQFRLWLDVIRDYVRGGRKLTRDEMNER